MKHLEPKEATNSCSQSEAVFIDVRSEMEHMSSVIRADRS